MKTTVFLVSVTFPPHVPRFDTTQVIYDFYFRFQYFWRRRMLMAKPLLKEHGIGSILLENPYCILLSASHLCINWKCCALKMKALKFC